MNLNETADIKNKIRNFSSPFNNSNEAAIVLAAGHGKRIKSQRSKMLHKIWEVPTVERVYNACINGIENINTVIVVGIKAGEVIDVIGKRENNKFAFQETQNGTGHAVQVALNEFDDIDDGIVYVLPGDMGLLDAETMKRFRKDFIESKSDMIVLTGTYSGPTEENLYGRVLRTEERSGDVIEIMEYKDIHTLKDNEPHRIKFKGKEYSFTKKQLLENNEFNSGVYAFKLSLLKELIYNLSDDNAQKEIYITDLISAFNEKGYSVAAVNPGKDYVVMGFNNKSVLKQMEAIARKNVYEKLKDIIEINDPEDFFIHESVVEQIIKMDSTGKPLDITVGKGVYIDKNVKLNYNIEFQKNSHITGNVEFGSNVVIWQNVRFSTFPDQKITMGNNVEILWADILKGNITIGDNTRIEARVNMTGSDEFPLRIGKNVLVKGTSYIFGSVLDDNTYVEHSVIIKKHIKAIKDKEGNIIKVRFCIPKAEGENAVENL